MKSRITILLAFSLALGANAFPPAPQHEVYGTVRDESGNPLSQKARVFMSDAAGEVIINGEVNASIASGVNYALKVPMDAGTVTQRYRRTALLPQMPYTMRVVIGATSYVPIEVQGGGKEIGEAGERTRLDLTLGVDSDGDGIPDSWEQDLIDSDANDRINNLAQVRGEDDFDGDGTSNHTEYIAGTYAFDGSDTLEIDIMETTNDISRMRFLAITGRSYTLKAAVDLKTYVPIPFSLAADGSGPSLRSLRADSVGFQDIYVQTSAEAPQQFFLLHVE